MADHLINPVIFSFPFCDLREREQNSIQLSLLSLGICGISCKLVLPSTSLILKFVVKTQNWSQLLLARSHTAFRVEPRQIRTQVLAVHPSILYPAYTCSVALLNVEYVEMRKTLVYPLTNTIDSYQITLTLICSFSWNMYPVVHQSFSVLVALCILSILPESNQRSFLNSSSLPSILWFVADGKCFCLKKSVRFSEG